MDYRDMDMDRDIQKDDDKNYYEKLDKDLENAMKDKDDRSLLGNVRGFEGRDKELQMRVGEEREMFNKGGGLFFRGDKDFEKDAINEYRK